MQLSDIAQTLKDIDICMLSSQTGQGGLESRPMSNNRDVDFNGDCYFFSMQDSSAPRQIAHHPQVNLAFDGKRGILKTTHTYVSVTGAASLVTDRKTMEKHWNKDLEIWFEEGLDTPGIVMIHVKATRLKYWNGEEQGEIKL